MKGAGNNIRGRHQGGLGCNGDFWTWQDYCTCYFTAAVVAFTRPAKRANQHHSAEEWRGIHKPPPLTEEPPTVDRFQERDSHFSLNLWPTVGWNSPLFGISPELHGQPKLDLEGNYEKLGKGFLGFWVDHGGLWGSSGNEWDPNTL